MNGFDGRLTVEVYKKYGVKELEANREQLSKTVFLSGGISPTHHGVVGHVPGRVIWPHTPTFPATAHFSTGPMGLRRIPTVNT